MSARGCAVGGKKRWSNTGAKYIVVPRTSPPPLGSWRGILLQVISPRVALRRVRMYTAYGVQMTNRVTQPIRTVLLKKRPTASCQRLRHWPPGHFCDRPPEMRVGMGAGEVGARTLT